MSANRGRAHIEARARLMLLLGEQLITDEIAAISELVKNAYDADATCIDVILENVSDPENGFITIQDNGHGMTLQTVLKSWLELGTSYKARDSSMHVRFSEFKKRIYLGEKGLGRLAVHKLGRVTELITRRKGTGEEVKLIIDWAAFENNDQLLGEVPIEYEITPPTIFKDSPSEGGTKITIRKLQRQWTSDMIYKTNKSLMAMKSPFTEFADFDVNICIKDKEAPHVEPFNFSEIIQKATYQFEGKINESGTITYRYLFKRPDLNMSRQSEREIDIRDPEVFSSNRFPICGQFKIRLYCWDLALADQKAVFGDASTYNDFIRPNSGVKVFRDGFRVLPYGNLDNDWLSMDMKRVKRFEKNVSRNQVLGAIEISLVDNPKLIDKTDREGLIDNAEFRDFYSLISTAITTFENERYPDKREVKRLTGRLRSENSIRTTFSRNMAMVINTIRENPDLPVSVKLELGKLIDEAHAALNTILADREQPLLVAASIGLTYMMPTHEARRELHEAMKLLRKGIDSGTFKEESVRPILSLLRQADETIQGIGRLMQQTKEYETFDLEAAIDDAIELMKFRFERNSITLEKEIRNKAKVKGSERLVTILLLNLLDNSLYWLLKKKPEERKVKLIVLEIDNSPAIIVSDSGPGFIDDITTLTLPFFTRKPNGMGLGLYISNRIARMNGGCLKIVDYKDYTRLYSGANIAIIFKHAEEQQD
jgi:signal transduction histidine kinase